jgi:beta-galactosidase
MLAVDAEGRPRGFGSRRHYDFSHDGYREECRRIARLMGERYGRTPTSTPGRSTTNTTATPRRSATPTPPGARFRDWLAQRYQSPEALNRAWGNVFWSMEYRDWDEIDLPNLTVTEPNPAHVMAFRRFSSDHGRALQPRAGGGAPQADRPPI